MTITVSEYATRYGCSSQFVNKQLRSGKLMTGMLGYRKIEGKTSSWLIEVNLEWYESNGSDLPAVMVCYHTYQHLKDDGHFYCSVCGNICTIFENNQ